MVEPRLDIGDADFVNALPCSKEGDRAVKIELAPRELPDEGELNARQVPVIASLPSAPSWASCRDSMPWPKRVLQTPPRADPAAAVILNAPAGWICPSYVAD